MSGYRTKDHINDKKLVKYKSVHISLTKETIEDEKLYLEKFGAKPNRSSFYAQAIKKALENK